MEQPKREINGVQTILRKKTEGLERSSPYFGAGNGNATYDQTMRVPARFLKRRTNPGMELSEQNNGERQQ